MLAGKFNHGRDVLQLINRLFLAGLVLLLSSTAHAAGTLSGTVVDAADGTTPVHPVWIWLWDPVDNVPVEGSGVNNSPDGSYLMENIPPGSYKVIYDAYSTATGYTDRLYDNVSCDPCDFNTSGDLLNVTDGLYQSDVQMERRPMLSGRVANESGVPIEGVQVELFDGAGNYFTSANHTGSDGMWYENVPGPGDYYARTAADTTPGYVPEIWDNMPCKDCDVVAKGKAITIDVEDVSGLNFYLSPPPPDLIFASSLERNESLLFIDAPCCGPLIFMAEVEGLAKPLVGYKNSGALSFYLAQSPEGMTIDESSGLIRWAPSSAQAGAAYPIQIQVTDGILNDEVTFNVVVPLGQPLSVESVGSTTTVTEPGDLEALSFDLPAPVSDSLQNVPSSISFFEVDPSEAPELPPGVSRISGVFFTDPIDSLDPIRVTLPIVEVPPGRELSELQIYIWSTGGRLPSGWVPSNFRMTITDDRASVDIYSSGTFMFIGLPAATQGAPLAQSSSKQALNLDQPQATGISCETGTYYPDGLAGSWVPRAKWTACILDDAENPMLVQIETLADGFWEESLQPSDIAEWLVASRATASALGMPVTNEQYVKIHPFDQDAKLVSQELGHLAGAVRHINGYNVIELNSEKSGGGYQLDNGQLTPRQWTQLVITHEYFHVAQHDKGLELWGKSTSATFQPTIRVDPTNWIIEATANWFVDEVFDLEDLVQKSMFGMNLETFYDDISKEMNSYWKWPFYKLITERCHNESIPDLFAVEADTSTSPGMDEMITRISLDWDCDFGNLLGSQYSATLDAAFLRYQLTSRTTSSNAEEFREDENIKFDFGPYYSPEPLPFPKQTGKSKIQDYDNFVQFANDPKNRDEIFVDKNSAKTVLIKGAPGNLRPWQTLNLLVKAQGSASSTFQPIIHILRHGAGTGHWFQIERCGNNYYSEGCEGHGAEYNFSDRNVPDLWVTIINPARTSNTLDLVQVGLGWELITDPKLTVQRIDTAVPPSPAQGGTVTVSNTQPDKIIDCKDVESCKDYYFDSGTSVTLTASEANGYSFLKWADDSEVCAGSEIATCEVTMDGDKIARAVFEEDFDYVLIYGTSTSSIEGFEVQGEIRKGDEFTAFPTHYTVGLKLSGEDVEIVNGGYLARLDVFDALNFEFYGPEDYPPAAEPAIDYEIQLSDYTNRHPDTGAPRAVRIPIKLRISNDAYRRIAGSTFVLGGRYEGDTMTLDPFGDGQTQGNMTYVEAEGNTINGSWSMIGSSSYSTFVRAPCSAFTPGALNPLIVRAGRARISGVSFPTLNAGGGHVWTGGNERDHYCAAFEEFRLITNDH